MPWGYFNKNVLLLSEKNDRDVHLVVFEKIGF